MKKLLKTVLFCLLTLFTVTAASASDGVSDEISASLSPALHIIAKDFGMEKAGLVGKNIVFSYDDFRRALNLSEISSITVTSLPDAACGKLFLGNNVITKGQTLQKANLDLIVFVPASDSQGTSAFEFSAEDRNYTLTCSVYLLSSVNLSPQIPDFKEFSNSVKTHSNTPLYSNLTATDPENDTVKYEIIKHPKNGLLILNDSEIGSYTYFPAQDFSGKDEFTYTVKDVYGNYASSRTVEISVEQLSTSIVYSDMVGNYANNSALYLAEAGIMFGNVSSGAGLFDPHGSVTREDFVVMAMKAFGITDLPESSPDFYDAASVSQAARPYVAAAKQLSFISGIEDENGNLCFLPNENITRAQASEIIDKMIDSSSYISLTVTLPVFSDSDSIPSRSEKALKNLNLLGLLRDDNGKINAEKSLSRADAAVLLFAVLNLK